MSGYRDFEWPVAPALLTYTGACMRHRRAPILLIALAGICVAAFFGILSNRFVSWDDRPNLIDNDAYKGLSFAHLRWMFTTPHAGHYQPLTWLSHAFDFTIWGGVDAFGTHLTNLILHLASTLGFFAVAQRLIAAAIARPEPGLPSEASSVAGPVEIGAFVAALAFAVHPLRVESVAWATERRDVLSGAWLMLATWAYLRAADSSGTSRRGWLGVALAAYIGSLLSKAVGITWPVVLLILDVYPLRRIAAGLTTDQTAQRAAGGDTIRRILAEKLFFLLPAAMCAGLAMWSQRAAGALWTLDVHPLSLRIAQAFYGIVFYLWKLLIPYPLLPLYEQPTNASPLDWAYVVSAAAVVAITAIAFALRKRWRGLLAAWAVYVVTLSPMLGIAQSGPQLVADRYSYIPSMAWCTLLGGVVTTAICGGFFDGRWLRSLARMGIAAWLIALVLLTRAQTSVWANTRTLWEHVLRFAPDTGLAHVNLAAELSSTGDYHAALDHATRAMTILPGNHSARQIAGRAAMEIGDWAAAEQHLKSAIERDPSDVVSRIRLATVFQRTGRLDDAAAQYAESVRMEPDDAARRLDFGGFLASMGQWEAALAEFEQAIRINPDLAEAYFRAGAVLENQGDERSALAKWQAGLAVAPGHAELLTKAAWVLATTADDGLRNPSAAVELAERAVRLTPPNHRSREALAAALAASGQFAQAASIIEELLRGVGTTVPAATRARLERALELYRTGRRWSEPS